MTILKCHICGLQKDWGIQVANQAISTTKWWCLGCLFDKGYKEWKESVQLNQNQNQNQKKEVAMKLDS